MKKWTCTPKRGRMVALLNNFTHMRPVPSPRVGLAPQIKLQAPPILKRETLYVEFWLIL